MCIALFFVSIPNHLICNLFFIIDHSLRSIKYLTIGINQFLLFLDCSKTFETRTNSQVTFEKRTNSRTTSPRAAAIPFLFSKCTWYYFNFHYGLIASSYLRVLFQVFTVCFNCVLLFILCSLLIIFVFNIIALHHLVILIFLLCIIAFPQARRSAPPVPRQTIIILHVVISFPHISIKL